MYRLLKYSLISFTILLSIIFIGNKYTYGNLNIGPTSSTYELRQFGFGTGGGVGSTSNTYSFMGIAGENGLGTGNTSTSYQLGSGLVYTQQAQVPAAPTFTNPGSNYDRLKIVINRGVGTTPSDTKFAVAISPDAFASTTKFVQSDGTVGAVLGTEDYLTYSSWGTTTGTWITGLTQNTTYTVKVKAQQGIYTETSYGTSATASTSVPSLTFGISSPTLTFSNLNSGNSYTDSTKTTVLSTTTNAYNGYIIYGRESGALTYRTSTIADYASPNSAPTTWSGTGFGYTTDDTTLSGGTANRFATATKYAGFVTSAPGDPVADNPGPLLSPASDTATISYRVTTSSSQNAGTYRTTVLYVIVPTY